jgi:hypothetical protein
MACKAPDIAPMAYGSVELSAIRSRSVSLQAAGCQGLCKSPKTRPLTARRLPLERLSDKIGWSTLMTLVSSRHPRGVR